MTKYREIKHLVHAENIVFWHAVQERWLKNRLKNSLIWLENLEKSCLINIPALLIFQKPVFTDLIGLKWLTFLCLSATSATLLSNTALQVWSNTYTLWRLFSLWNFTVVQTLDTQNLSLPLFDLKKSSRIQAWFQWPKVSTCQLQP